MEIFCFSHLRWDFVYQRPQHLMSRFAAQGQVHVWEEPILEDASEPSLMKSRKTDNLEVLTPVLPRGSDSEQIIAAQQTLLDDYLTEHNVTQYVAWYYTPMALPFTGHLKPLATVYDCMDELSAFQGAPPELIGQERLLFAKADVIFVGGASLFESKRLQHDNAHLFPSSIDREHFASARSPQVDPVDQASIPHPRIGFYGVLDERLDRDLLKELAISHPEWHFILVGPTAKISPEHLPRAPNLHYLGPKTYAQLPVYLANWDVAMLPFACDASTRFISPTKTPEYLAGGKPVVSTPIQDVVKPYGENGLVRIGSSAAEFAKEISLCLESYDPGWIVRVDGFLARTSWNQTFEDMQAEVRRVIAQRQAHTSAGLNQE